MKKINNWLYEPRFAMITMKTGACLESDPAQNQSGNNLSAHQCWVLIIKYSENMYI